MLHQCIHYFPRDTPFAGHLLCRRTSLPDWYAGCHLNSVSLSMALFNPYQHNSVTMRKSGEAMD